MYGLDAVSLAILNVLLPRYCRRVNCVDDFQLLLSADAACFVIEPSHLHGEQWGLLTAHCAERPETLLLFTEEPAVKISIPYLVIGLKSAASENRDRAVTLLQKAGFPCLLPDDSEVGRKHILNDGFVAVDIETSGLDPVFTRSQRYLRFA